MTSGTDEAVGARRFYMERPKLAFDLSYMYEKDERSGPFIDREDTSHTFNETLHIATSGFVYHPALLTYKLELSPEWEQIKETNKDQNERKSDSFLEGYFAEATILQYKPYTLVLFGNRDMSTITHTFARTSKNKTESYGANLILKYNILPTTIRYTHSESDQTGFFTKGSTADEWNLTMKHDKYLGSSQLDASVLNSDESTRGSVLDKNQYSASYNNIYKFRKATLNSNISYLDLDGTNTTSKRFTLLENLNWVHRYNLKTNYVIRYNKNDLFNKTLSQSSNTENRSLGFKLTHLLYENLTTTFRIDSAENRSIAGRNAAYGYGLDFAYRRSIPWGRINITAGFNHQIVDNRINPETSRVFEPDEVHVLATGDTEFLDNRNVITDTIIVRAAGPCPGIDPICTEGVDYTIVQVGTSTGIRPLASLNNESVLVDYNYVPEPAFDYSTIDRHYGINLYLWSALRLYYRVDLSKQRERSGVASNELLDDSIHRAGTELEWKWTTTTFEWEDWYSVNTPREKWTIKEAIVLRPANRIFLRLSARYGETEFKETDENERFLGLRTDFQWLISRNALLSLGAFSDEIEGSTENRRNTGYESSLEWAYRIYTMEINYRFFNEKDKISGEDFNNQTFEFKLTRTLF